MNQPGQGDPGYIELSSRFSHAEAQLGQDIFQQNGTGMGGVYIAIGTSVIVLIIHKHGVATPRYPLARASTVKEELLVIQIMRRSVMDCDPATW